MTSVVSASRTRTSSARKKERVNQSTLATEQPQAGTHWECAQGQRNEAKQKALAKLMKHKPVEKPE
jgi:hypothetical protein